MATPRDPYEVLGVRRDASPQEIRAAYLELVARYHPDRHDGNPLRELAEERLAQVNSAYEVLSDPKRRARHDSPLAGAEPAGGLAPDPLRAWIRRGVAVVLILLFLPLLLRVAAVLLRVLARGGPVTLALGAVAAVFVAAALLRRRRARGGPGPR